MPPPPSAPPAPDSPVGPRFASRTNALTPFLAMEILERAIALEQSGVSIAHLEVGEPEFAPPPAAVRACRAALAADDTGYTDSRGLWPLREAIAANLAARFGRSVPAERVLVTQGTSSAMTLAFAALVEPGDEVVIPTPHYPCYPNFVRVMGAHPVFVPTGAADGYAIDPDRVRRAITSRTRAIVYGSPANPTGAVQPREVVEALAALGPPLVADEIYDGLLYGGVKNTSALEVGDDAYVLDGFSKRYAMTGFRLGWIVAPAAAMRHLQTLQQNLFISASSFVQRAGIAALAEGQAMAESMRRACEARRDLLVGGLRSLGFGIDRDPDGALYVLADARRFGSDSRALAFRLLEEARVGTTPGIDFGEAAEGRLRFCYARSRATIETALERLAPVLERIESEQAGGSGVGLAKGGRRA
ncbi:MAG: pyridoxal phosphate-dependent aminotransferase [Deltaproteobacteria bacterium]|nr:pyridoxal phosphate-dependent aminotransferase [Deltaproteobacteria bacterium]